MKNRKMSGVYYVRYNAACREMVSVPYHTHTTTYIDLHTHHTYHKYTNNISQNIHNTHLDPISYRIIKVYQT